MLRRRTALSTTLAHPGIYNAVSRSDLWAPACARHRAPPRYTKCACGRTLTDHRSLTGVYLETPPGGNRKITSCSMRIAAVGPAR